MLHIRTLPTSREFRLLSQGPIAGKGEKEAPLAEEEVCFGQNRQNEGTSFTEYFTSLHSALSTK